VPRPLVHVTGHIPSAIEAELERDFELVDEPGGADGVLSPLTTPIDEAFLERAGPSLRIVANYAVGVDNVDLEAARARGIVVANTPDVLTRATAELAITLTLTLLRRVAEGDRMIRAQRPWGFGLEFMLGGSLDGATFGVVGPGRIGREAARLAEAFGATSAFVDRDQSLEPLLEAADVVSLHCPLTAETRNLIDANALAHMKPTAVLVNTARGPVIEERALVEALQTGTIAGAALDVYWDEPNVPAELLELENVVLSPHLGSATRVTRHAMGMLAVNALRAVLLEGRRPPNTVD
jgi:lactate dehydrogenase-like 2-hydroxyacid dehydrogenase